MAGKRLNPRRAKRNRNYSIAEVAQLYGVHRQTVRNWIKNGLPVMTAGRPHLVAGEELGAFLGKRRADGQTTCRPGELYCLRCRAARPAAEGMLDYIPITNLSGNLRGLCPVCHGLVHRRVSLNKLDLVRGSCAVAFPQGHKRVTDSGQPSLNCHPAREAQDPSRQAGGPPVLQDQADD